MFSLLLRLTLSHKHLRHFRPQYRHSEYYDIPPPEIVYEEQLTDLGLSNESYSDLIFGLKKFGIPNEVVVGYFIAICAYNSDNGTRLIEDEFGDKYRGAGFLMLKGDDNYLNFGQLIADNEIIEEGAEYVRMRYPWSSAAYLWKENYMNDYCAFDSTKKIVSITKACKEMLGKTCDKEKITKEFELVKKVMSDGAPNSNLFFSI